MPKISRITQLILVLGILLILFVALFMVWQGQVKAQENLKKELTSARTILAKPSPPKLTDLEAKIRAAEAELRATEALFPPLEQSLDITDNLFKLAKQSQLEVVGMSTAIIKKKIDKVDYQVIHLELELEGQIASMVGFIDKLKTELPTAEIVSVSLDKSVEVKELDKGKVGLYIYVRRGS